METPSFKEDHISQIPALQMLVNLGYTYLSPAEAERQRGGKTTNVLLEDVLKRQLKEINAEKAISSSKSTYISDANIDKGIQILKNLPMNEGYIAACEKAYNLLTLGHALEQSVDGDKKSFTLQYIDWKNIGNNVFHVIEEFSVMRSTSKEHYRPDLVLFVNGIPFCIIECKRPDMKEPLKQAISQHLRSQQEDGIRNLYVYSQLTLSIATQEAAYATNATPEKFWAKWKESEELKVKNERVKLKGQFLEVWALDSSRVKELVDNWYFNKAKEKIKPLAEQLFNNFILKNNLSLYAFNFSFRNMPTRWGSCTPKGKIILNPELIKAPKGCIEYVIIHELCHLIHHDHTQKFINLQTKEMKDWEKWKIKLEKLLA